MSTRCTIWYSDRLHLYRECLDDSIWLEVSHEFGSVLIPLPQDMLKTMLASESVKDFAENGPDKDWIGKDCLYLVTPCAVIGV